MLTNEERKQIEEVIRILMREQRSHDYENIVNLHNTIEGLRLILDPTYVGLF